MRKLNNKLFVSRYGEQCGACLANHSLKLKIMVECSNGMRVEMQQRAASRCVEVYITFKL